MAKEVGMVHVDGYASKPKVIAQVIQNEILTGDLKPGTLLRQEELAERFEVSPTPVREALRELGARGLVVHELHRGVRVADIRTDTLEEIRQIRALLEPYATELATPLLGEDEIGELEEINRAIGRSGTSQEQIRILNRKFHMQIYEAASSGHLMSLINLTWSAYPWMSLMLPRARVSVARDQHQAILDAMAARDGQLASSLMGDHIRGSLVQPVSSPE